MLLIINKFKSSSLRLFLTKLSTLSKSHLTIFKIFIKKTFETFFRNFHYFLKIRFIYLIFLLKPLIFYLHIFIIVVY